MLIHCASNGVSICGVWRCKFASTPIQFYIRIHVSRHKLWFDWCWTCKTNSSISSQATSSNEVCRNSTMSLEYLHFSTRIYWVNFSIHHLCFGSILFNHSWFFRCLEFAANSTGLSKATGKFRSCSEVCHSSHLFIGGHGQKWWRKENCLCFLASALHIAFAFSIQLTIFAFQVKENVGKLVKNRIRSACTNDTLLHLCVSRLNVIKSGYFNDGTPVGVSIIDVQVSSIQNPLHLFFFCRVFSQIIVLSSYCWTAMRTSMPKMSLNRRLCTLHPLPTITSVM